ncbi:hypothetical protein RISK_004400 [Rhodopirellula islandica]|uniref:Uncharacterized protein n=1 Tax=Rhodopirellula islandica TaxID=595434 RepID=A0A0J1BAF7_RHOIS|nr:hypothetical protein RISK_004400 [Rhodopirellula islandica]
MFVVGDHLGAESSIGPAGMRWKDAGRVMKTGRSPMANGPLINCSAGGGIDDPVLRRWRIWKGD